MSAVVIEKQKDLLALETRRKIYDIIKEQPGICIRELERTSGFAIGELTYHLPLLSKAGLLDEENDNYFRRFYLAGMKKEDLAIISMLRREAVRKVIPLFFENEKVSVKLLSKKLGVSASTASWHINRMKQNKLIKELNGKGKERFYTLKEADAIKRIYLL
jgi:predicted transcriptional regulator